MKSECRMQNAELIGRRKTTGSGILTSKSISPTSKFHILHSSLSGFTLIEMLVVMVIIAILAALTLGISKYAFTKAGTSRAQGEIAAMESALESYKIDNGIYPPSTTTRICPACASNNSALLYQALSPSSGKKYFSFKAEQIKGQGIADPFGAFYNYYCNPGAADQTNRATFDLWSYGPNGINDEGTNDDIVNWRH